MTRIPHHDVEFIPPAGAHPQAVAEMRERWLHDFMLDGVDYDAKTLAAFLGTTSTNNRMPLLRMARRGLIVRVGEVMPYVYRKAVATCE